MTGQQFDIDTDNAADVSSHEITAKHRLDIKVVKTGQSGARYRATCRGEIVVETSHAPVLAACRVLAARGDTGSMTVFGPPAGSPPRLHVPDIVSAAAFTVSETPRVGPKFVPWQAFEPTSDADS